MITYQERIRGYVQDVSCFEISYANHYLSNQIMERVYEAENKNNQYGETIPTRDARKNFVISYYKDLLKRAKNEEHIANAVRMLKKLSA